MAKNTLYLYLLIFITTLISCDSITPEASEVFVGEYWMETKSVYVTENEQTSMESIWSLVTIYEQDSKLFVQTEFFGAADLENENPREIESYRVHPDSVSASISFWASDGYKKKCEIDKVKDNTSISLCLANGFILATIHGKYAKSLPIEVKSGSRKMLKLEEYQPVEMALFDANNTRVGSVLSWYEYGSIYKKSDGTIAWDVELKLDYNYQGINGDDYDNLLMVSHNNILYKR